MNKKAFGLTQQVIVAVIVWTIVLGAIGTGVFLIVKKINSRPKYDYDSFAQCLTEKNITMFGSVTCSHCNNQKRLFSESFKYITYIECSIGGTPEVCLENNILGLPTWEIKGTHYEGFLKAEQLSELSGCELEVIKNG